MVKFDKIAYLFETSLVKSFYKRFHRQCLAFVKEYIKSDFRVLDVACGTGSFLNLLKKTKKGLEFVGIDQSEKMLAIDRKKFQGIKLIQADAERLPFKNSYFDFISMTDSFYYFKDKKRVLCECSRVLKPCGYLLLYTPSVDKLLTRIGAWAIKWFYTEKDTKHLRFKDMKTMAERAGFRIIKKQLKNYPWSPVFKSWMILFQKSEIEADEGQ